MWVPFAARVLFNSTWGSAPFPDVAHELHAFKLQARLKGARGVGVYAGGASLSWGRLGSRELGQQPPPFGCKQDAKRRVRSFFFARNGRVAHGHSAILQQRIVTLFWVETVGWFIRRNEIPIGAIAALKLSEAQMSSQALELLGSRHVDRGSQFL